jgi:hypothetical protein
VALTAAGEAGVVEETMAYTSGRLYAGQTTGIGAVTAVPIASGSIAGSTGVPNTREVIVQSDPANTTNMLIGSSLSQFLVLTPGQSINVPVINPTLIYAVMVSGTGTINWFARD